MEEEYFNELRALFCSKNSGIKPGKMMTSEAITYNGKVFAFFSRQKKMVFKLGTEFNPDSKQGELSAFNPFQKRAPLHGWYEAPFSDKDYWLQLATQALELMIIERSK